MNKKWFSTSKNLGNIPPLTERPDALIPINQTKWAKGDLNSRPLAIRATSYPG